VDSLDLKERNDGVWFHHNIDQFNKGLNVGVHVEALPNTWLSKAIQYLTVELGPRCDTIQSEVVIGINWLTGEVVLPQGVEDRAYPDDPNYEWGTADILAILHGGELLVGDWKTGSSEGAKDQLKSLACGFQKAMPDPTRLAGAWPRPVRISCLYVNENGVWPDEREVSQQELDLHATSMRIAWEDYRSGNVSPPIPGIHCTALYCPHLAYCSSHSETVALEGGKEVRPVAGLTYTDKPCSNAEAGYSMSLISAARRQMKYTEAKLKDYCASGGRVIAGNQEWKERSNGWRWGKIDQ